MPFSTFFLNFDLFQTFFQHINAPLLGLFWKTEVRGMRGGAFSIRSEKELEGNLDLFSKKIRSFH